MTDGGAVLYFALARRYRAKRPLLYDLPAEDLDLLLCGANYCTERLPSDRFCPHCGDMFREPAHRISHERFCWARILGGGIGAKLLTDIARKRRENRQAVKVKRKAKAKKQLDLFAPRPPELRLVRSKR